MSRAKAKHARTEGMVEGLSLSGKANRISTLARMTLDVVIDNEHSDRDERLMTLVSSIVDEVNGLEAAAERLETRAQG
jgi:hypothetical protein